MCSRDDPGGVRGSLRVSWWVTQRVQLLAANLDCRILLSSVDFTQAMHEEDLKLWVDYNIGKEWC